MEKITKSSDTVLIDPNEPLILPDGTALVGRIEWFLYALCCLDYQNLPTPMSRIEEFANALITGEIPNIEPQSRAEQFFLAILDGNVSNLPQPQSRSEVLLDKLARGEFDLSDVELIQSHYELLLAYLIKNGGIGNIDYVLYEFSEAMKTMYNTVEKPFKSLELSGNTLVNCVLEDTENDDYTSFDKDYSETSFTINGTSEGAIKSAILKGNTGYRDIDTGEFLETFEEGRNLELVSVKMPVLTTTGKNLFDVDNILYNTWVDSSNPNSVGKGNTRNTLDFTKVEPNQKIIASGLRVTGAYGYDANKKFIEGISSNIITTTGVIIPPNVYYIRLTFDNTVDFNNAQLEYGLTSTTYEPYKSNILSTPEDLELRGIGNVKDELNVATGELTQRIGEIVLDGSEVIYFGENLGSVSRYAVQLTHYAKNDSKVMCDSLPSVLSFHDETDHIFANLNDMWLFVSNDKTGGTVEGLKQWLSQNPVKIQYQLLNESIKTVDLNVVDQSNTKIDKIHVFDEVTHVNTSSDGLTPTVNIGKSVSYPTIIKPSTKYTIDLKRNNKPLTVDLGGTEVTFTGDETRKTITTPSTLVNDKLSYYGVGAKCNEIMLIEGEIERNIDYFTGMQSVVMQNQMPILSTVGKNLFDTTTQKLGSYWSSENTYNTRDGSYISDTYVKVTTGQKLRANNTSGSVQYMEFDSNKNFIQRVNVSSNDTYTVPNNVSYLRFSFYDCGEGHQCQVEEGTSSTTYEAHKSSILSCNEEVTLRGIGDVQDTLDCLTGEVVQNIYEFILDGSQDIDNDGNLLYYYLPLGVHNNRSSSDKLPSITVGQILDGLIGVAPQNRGNASRVYINVNGITTKEEMKNFFLNNPTTIQCVLTEKSARTVDLNVVDKDGNAIPKIKSYKDVTHLEVTVPKQSLLPNISAEVATDNSKDMSSLAEKHQEISEAQSVIQNSIQSQSDEIDTALMATTEIFESILE